MSCSILAISRDSTCLVSYSIKHSLVTANINPTIKLSNSQGESSVFTLNIQKVNNTPIACIPENIDHATVVTGNQPNCVATTCAQYYEVDQGLCKLKVLTLYSELKTTNNFAYYLSYDDLMTIKVREIDLATNTNVGIRSNVGLSNYGDFMYIPFRHIRNFTYTANYPTTPVACSAMGGSWVSSDPYYVGVDQFYVPQFVADSYCEIPENTCLAQGYFYQTDSSGNGLNYATSVTQDIGAPRFKFMTSDTIVSDMYYHNLLIARYPTYQNQAYDRLGRMPKCVGIARIQDQRFENQGGPTGTPVFSQTKVSSVVQVSLNTLEAFCPNGTGFFTPQEFIDYGQALLDYLANHPQAMCRYPAPIISQEQNSQ